MSYFEKIKQIQLNPNPIIMGIETSCDETAVAIVRGGREILADEIISSATEHAKFGGVVPEIASRSHTSAILQATQNALKNAPKIHLGARFFAILFCVIISLFRQNSQHFPKTSQKQTYFSNSTS